MKVEIIRETGAVIGEKPHMQGEVLNVDGQTARLWIKRGHAKPYEEQPTPKAAAPKLTEAATNNE